VSVARRFLAIACCLGAFIAGCSGQAAKSPKPAAQSAALDPPPELPAPPPYAPRPAGTLTFAKDIGPIVLEKCAGCHHPGEIGPFPLLCFADVKKRARQIVEITQKRIMPPWSPVPGYCEFERDRGLSAAEIGMIDQWVAEGTSEGDISELPPPPEFPTGWRYGPPDLVVTMPEAFAVPADAAADVYRKFVIPVPIGETRYVRAFDFDPGNESLVHHMRLRVDRSGLCRAQEEQDPSPGFDGILFSGDTEPDGFFLVWTPGYEAQARRADVAWKLEPGTDLVLELHLHPTGKPESVQSSIALYFQPEPPRERLHMVQLSCETIDIAPGKKGDHYEDRYVLPVDTTVLAAMPHAHYLATEFRAWAELPDGRKEWLMRIADWDFNWQREYTYAEPMTFPKGTALYMRVTYDNTAENPRNPHHPPQRVLIGRDTFNEMAQVFFQVLAVNPEDNEVLAADFHRKEFANNLLREEFLLARGSGTTEVHFNLGCLYAISGRTPEALRHYRESIRLKPDNVFAVNNLGGLYRRLGRTDDAAAQYARALEINPRDARVRYNLGLIDLDRGLFDSAESQFELALQLNSDLAEAWVNLGAIALRQGKLELAETHLQRAIQANPRLESARAALRSVQARLAGSR
jgi:tetratricopeptide (TPR) repeat protein